MGNRIGDYKVRIKTAKNLPVPESTMKGEGDVKLIPLDELEQIEFERTHLSDYLCIYLLSD